jgi:hypothetical protein
LVASCARRLSGSKMPKMSRPVIVVRLPLGVGRERGRFFLPAVSRLAIGESAKHGGCKRSP